MDQERLRPMATDLNKFDQELLGKAIEALHNWFKLQSVSNVSTLYNAASNLFGSDFNPTEYDDVE